MLGPGRSGNELDAVGGRDAGSAIFRLTLIKTTFTELLGIEHPIALAGMAGDTTPELVAAVTNAGGLGILGVTDHEPARLDGAVADIRQRTQGKFGLNLLLTFMTDEEIDLVLATRPPVFSTA